MASSNLVTNFLKLKWENVDASKLDMTQFIKVY